jgi:hypothetical protein
VLGDVGRGAGEESFPAGHDFHCTNWYMWG